MTDITLPCRFREKAFRRYEHIIAKIVDSFPEPVLIDPAEENLSPVTLSARLRDAMRSLSVNQWATKEVNLSSFLLNYDKIIIRELVGGLVVAGTRESTKTAEAKLTNVASSSEKHFALVINNDATAVQAACDLLARKLLHGPVKVTNMLPEDLKFVEDNYELAVVESDGYLTIL